MASKPTGKQVVDAVLMNFDAKQTKKWDEPGKRELVNTMVALEKTDEKAKAFLQDKTAYYRWLAQAGPGTAWSIAELEGAPFLSADEREAWSALKGPVERAEFLIQVMQDRATALLKRMSKEEELNSGAVKLRARFGKI